MKLNKESISSCFNQVFVELRNENSGLCLNINIDEKPKLTSNVKDQEVLKDLIEIVSTRNSSKIEIGHIPFLKSDKIHCYCNDDLHFLFSIRDYVWGESDIELINQDIVIENKYLSDLLNALISLDGKFKSKDN